MKSRHFHQLQARHTGEIGWLDEQTMAKKKPRYDASYEKNTKQKCCKPGSQFTGDLLQQLRRNINNDKA